jgi:hypothetical protein
MDALQLQLDDIKKAIAQVDQLDQSLPGTASHPLLAGG